MNKVYGAIYGIDMPDIAFRSIALNMGCGRSFFALNPVAWKFGRDPAGDIAINLFVIFG